MRNKQLEEEDNQDANRMTNQSSFPIMPCSTLAPLSIYSNTLSKVCFPPSFHSLQYRAQKGISSQTNVQCQCQDLISRYRQSTLWILSKSYACLLPQKNKLALKVTERQPTAWKRTQWVFSESLSRLLLILSTGFDLKGLASSVFLPTQTQTRAARDPSVYRVYLSSKTHNQVKDYKLLYHTLLTGQTHIWQGLESFFTPGLCLFLVAGC